MRLSCTETRTGRSSVRATSRNIERVPTPNYRAVKPSPDLKRRFRRVGLFARSVGGADRVTFTPTTAISAAITRRKNYSFRIFAADFLPRRRFALCDRLGFLVIYPIRDHED
jgi:hypothetical protein